MSAQDEPVPVRLGPRPVPDEDEARAPARPRLRRSAVYTRTIVDGRPLRDSAAARLREAGLELLRGKAEREELDAETRLGAAAARAVTRSNTLACISPKGGVGKTTTTFVLGSILASHLKLRVLAVDANPDFGTLAALAPDGWRVERNLADLLADLDQIHSGSQLRPYISQLPSGLHLLGAPLDAQAMAAMTIEAYGILLAFLARYYDVVLLDCGTGITDPLARSAVRRADQVLVVTTPEFVTAQTVLASLDELELDRSILVLNQAERGGADRRAVESRFPRERVGPRIAIPYDDQLRSMLDSATYSLEALERRVRLPIKQLALAVARELV